ncbi:MAG: UPF0280 family protein, partial [Clostridia bacterium]|nr:UPF0280 family protein [Clostridia bacterium]
METKRFYRESFKAQNLCFFEAKVDQTDLYIGAVKNLRKEALELITHYRKELMDYIKGHDAFLHSLVPVAPLPNAPLIVLDMCQAASLADVGPMAAVAGAFSKFAVSYTHL